MQPRFPIFIPSLSRSESRYTVKALQRMGIERWWVVVEPHQIEQYAAVIPREHILELDLDYKRRYETCDNLGLSKSTGSGPARNFIWDKAIAMGEPFHWIMDDNIARFARLHENLKIEVLDGAFFRVMEDFVLRYENVAMAGPNYWMFAPRKQKVPPIAFNTRLYSCNLIRNDLPFRWRGRYNEDTILSLDMLKAGLCTVQFNAFLQEKLWTQTVKGGNMEAIYTEGTSAKSQMLVDVHPDVASLSWKFHRAHHHVNYKAFAGNKLIRKAGLEIDPKPNNYGLERVAK